jgi:hypothetical protein
MMDSPSWPKYKKETLKDEEVAKSVFTAEVSDVGSARKADHDATIARDKAQEDAFISWATANRNADIANLDKFNTSMYSVASGSIERGRSGAELVQKASAAIATLYTGVLALVFSVTSNPLPARGVLTPLFLGLAVVLSTAYIAYLGPSKGLTPGPTPTLGLEPKSFQRLNTFIAVTSTIATRRSRSLRASVVALGFGLIYIAAPFISFTHVASDTKALPTSPTWPKPPTGATSELDKTLFAAQVKEVADARAQTTTGGDRNQDLTVLIIGIVVGGLAVWIIPMVTERRDSRSKRQGGQSRFASIVTSIQNRVHALQEHRVADRNTGPHR